MKISLKNICMEDLDPGGDLENGNYFILFFGILKK